MICAYNLLNINAQHHLFFMIQILPPLVALQRMKSLYSHRKYISKHNHTFSCVHPPVGCELFQKDNKINKQNQDMINNVENYTYHCNAEYHEYNMNRSCQHSKYSRMVLITAMWTIPLTLKGDIYKFYEDLFFLTLNKIIKYSNNQIEILNLRLKDIFSEHKSL